MWRRASIKHVRPSFSPFSWGFAGFARVSTRERQIETVGWNCSEAPRPQSHHPFSRWIAESARGRVSPLRLDLTLSLSQRLLRTIDAGNPPPRRKGRSGRAVFVGRRGGCDGRGRTTFAYSILFGSAVRQDVKQRQTEAISPGVFFSRLSNLAAGASVS